MVMPIHEKIGLHILYERTKQKKRIIPMFHVYLTKGCNMNCTYCNKSKETGFMDTDKFKEIMKLLKNHVYTVVIFGYEPSLHPELDEIVNFLNREGFRYSISTNGLNLEKVIESGAKMINLTVEGFKREHLPDEYSWKKTAIGLEGLKILHDYSIKGVVGVTVTKLNIDVLADIVKYVSKYEHRCCPCPVTVNKKGRLVSLDYKPAYALEKEDCEKIRKVIKELEELYKEGYEIDPPSVFRTWIPHAWKQEWRCTTNCLLSVDVDGSFMPCFDFPNKFSAKSIDEVLSKRMVSAKECTGCVWTNAILSEKVLKGEESLDEVV